MYQGRTSSLQTHHHVLQQQDLHQPMTFSLSLALSLKVLNSNRQFLKVLWVEKWHKCVCKRRSQTSSLTDDHRPMWRPAPPSLFEHMFEHNVAQSVSWTLRWRQLATSFRSPESHLCSSTVASPNEEASADGVVSRLGSNNARTRTCVSMLLSWSKALCWVSVHSQASPLPESLWKALFPQHV